MYRILQPGWNRTCQGITRRELLQVGSISALGLSLPTALRAAEIRDTRYGIRDEEYPSRIAHHESRIPHPASRSPELSCIFLFLWGGPPQHELWDPKPDAPSDIAGPVKPIRTSADGIRIGELLPKMAQQAHHYVLVRSAHHDSDVHGNGAHANQTGLPKQPNLENPNMGSVVDRFSQSRGPLPQFVTVGPVLTDAPVLPTGQEGGFLGNAHQPFRITDPLAPVEKQPSLSPPSGITVDRLLRRDALYRGIDRFQRAVETDSTRGYDTAYERALALTTSPSAKEAFDLQREPAPLRERYGKTTFGQGCLLARRLVEAGVRYVQVNWAGHPINDDGFDNHSDNLNRLKDHQLPKLDQALSALIEDLAQRGLYQRTLVIATGEFGRTPKINGSGGRDHWPWVYSFLIGGAGVPGGRAIGASDAQGAYPASTPITPEMRAASVFSLMGLDLTALRGENILGNSEGIPGLMGG
jgi:hypothetical protein